MITEELQQKINDSIALIRKGEKLALLMQPDYGYHVGFSGGKDSQAVLELVKMAGVKYRAVYNVTTNDPPENVYFIREHYPNVEFSHPDTTYLRLIEDNGLPNRMARFCCRILKERSGIGFATITGVRHSESRNRGGISLLQRYATKSMKPKTSTRWRSRSSNASEEMTRSWYTQSLNGQSRTCGTSLTREGFRTIRSIRRSGVSAACSAHSLASASFVSTERDTPSSTRPFCAACRDTSTITTPTSRMRQSVMTGGKASLV